MKCWICGAVGNTREHLIKASDLRLHFGNFSQSAPIYSHTSEKKNLQVGSPKSNRFKSRTRICEQCNTFRTQAYDRAWEQLSSYLKTNWLKIVAAGEFAWLDIFSDRSRNGSLDVHLYFVKLFGCRIIEHNVPIDITGFSRAILDRAPHDAVYLTFGPQPEKTGRKCLGLTKIDSTNLNGRSAFTTCSYIIDQVAVNIIYSPICISTEILGNVWHPAGCAAIVKLTYPNIKPAPY